MSIQEHLNKIRNAIYGREVRESIAKGIETAYDDAGENGNANMEVKIARGTHPNLRSRLDETTEQLAQTEQEIERVEEVAITSTVNQSRIPNNEISSSKLRTTNQEDRIKLVNLHEEVYQAMTGQTPVGSIPENGSVTIEKLAPQLQVMFVAEGEVW